MARPVPSRRHRDDDDDPPKDDDRRSRRSRDDDDADDDRPRRSRDDADDDRPRRSRDDDDDDRGGRSRGRGELPSRGRGRDDDQDDDRPRRSRDRDDEPPADDDDRRPRGRARDDDDDRGSRRSSRDDDRGSRRSRDRDDDDRGRGSRRSRDDDDDRPKRQAKGGWASWRKAREESMDFDELTVTEEEQLIKVLDDEPFDTYGWHWIDEKVPKDMRQGNICIADIDDCPLDAIGHTAQAIGLFNVVVMSGSVPKLKVLVAKPAIAKELEHHSKAKHGPLSKEYYSISKTVEKKGPNKFHVDLVRERDLEDEWKVEPLTDKELDDFEDKRFGDGFVKYPKKEDLQEIADYISA